MLDNIIIEREACKRSLSTFVKEAWHVLEPGQQYIHGWHIDAMCEHLEAVTYGDITRLLINVPPGTMKSMLVNVLWPAWEWGPMNMPHIRNIGASHEQSLAVRDAMKMRRLITSEWFQIRWPLKLTGDQNQKTKFENASTGFRQACAVGSMTGNRGDRVTWDDPHSVEAAMSDAHRETAIRVFTETLPTRLNNPKSSAITVIMQRLHENDVSGYILANDLGYVHLMLPMEFEQERKCTTSIGFTDPRTEDGELLFNERFPEEVVERDKKIMGSFASAGQFQQRPSPRGGGIYKDSWWKYYTVIPELQFKMIYADTAQKTKEKNDYSVFQCWGMGADRKNIYLLDLVRGKWEAPELLSQARSFWNKHKHGGVTLRSMNIEDKASGTGLIQTLSREGIPIKAVQRNIDKITRAYDAAPVVEAGFVYIPYDADWLSDFLNEVRNFPNGKNDDQVDPLNDAIKDLLQKSSPVLSGAITFIG